MSRRLYATETFAVDTGYKDTPLHNQKKKKKKKCYIH